MAARRSAIVVGGGIGGLSWALDAARAGLDVTVVERDHRLGGVIRTEQLGPVHVDVGAESFALTRPDVLLLAEQLDLSEEVTRPAVAQSHVARRGSLMRLPPGLLGIPAEADDIASLLGEGAAARARELDAAPVSDEPPPTIGRLVRDRLGDVVADVLVDPVLAGVHATEADEAELASVAPSLHAAMRTHGGLMPAVRALRGPLGPAGSPVATITGGMGRLVERLHATLVDHGVTVRLGTEVTAIDHSGMWQAETSAGRLRADVLCLAVPARIAAGLLRTIVDASSAARAAELASGLSGLPTTHDVLLVTLLIEDAALTRAGTPVGSGVLVADDTVTAKAMTHASAKWAWLAELLPSDHHVVRLSYGGTRQLEEADTTSVVETARSDLLELFGGAAEVGTVRAALVTRWRDSLSRPVVGRASRLADIDTQLAAFPLLALTGSGVAGNGLAGVVGRSRSEAGRILGPHETQDRS